MTSPDLKHNIVSYTLSPSSPPQKKIQKPYFGALMISFVCDHLSINTKEDFTRCFE